MLFRSVFLDFDNPLLSAKYLDEIINDKIILKRISENALISVVENYNLNAILKMNISFYQKCMSNETLS